MRPSASTGGTSVATGLACAFSYNSIMGNTFAYASNANISSASSLSVNAHDQSTINADAGGVALSASLSSKGDSLPVITCRAF
jgi:hypothetical protein